MNNPKNVGPTAWQSPAMQTRIKQRYARERRFRLLGMASIMLAVGFLLWLLASVVSGGFNGFFQTRIALDIAFDPAVMGIDAEALQGPQAEGALRGIDAAALVRAGLQREFPDVKSRAELRRMIGLISNGGRYHLLDMVRAEPTLIGAERRIWLLASDDVDQFQKGAIRRDVDENSRRISDREIVWIDHLIAEKRIKTSFNLDFFQGGDSREPELAGIWGAIKGSFLTLVVTLVIAFPIGAAAAIYLEEFAAKNRWTDLIEVNINNLAAVPSIVFGLLALAVFLNFFGLPRSAPLVGGLTLALATLPTIIIAARAAIQAVPGSIRDAAMGLGASPLQVVFDHVIPLALPGILTGTIIGMGRALGETAPLLMIGMVAFIVDTPQHFTDAATVLPVQIYLWADSPERAFVEKTSAAIIVLLVFLVAMNAVAVFLRNKFERRW